MEFWKYRKFAKISTTKFKLGKKNSFCNDSFHMTNRHTFRKECSPDRVMLDVTNIILAQNLGDFILSDFNCYVVVDYFEPGAQCFIQRQHKIYTRPQTKDHRQQTTDHRPQGKLWPFISCTLTLSLLGHINNTKGMKLKFCMQLDKRHI